MAYHRSRLELWEDSFAKSVHREVEEGEEEHQQEGVVWFRDVGGVVEDYQGFDLAGDEERCRHEAYLPGYGCEPACDV